MTHDHTFAYSTNIKRIQYESPDMIITFKQGRRYRFKDVPEAIFEAMKTADSPGKYYFNNIQKAYQYEEL
jgi:hypothetical protein